MMSFLFLEVRKSCSSPELCIIKVNVGLFAIVFLFKWDTSFTSITVNISFPQVSLLPDGAVNFYGCS